MTVSSNVATVTGLVEDYRRTIWKVSFSWVGTWHYLITLCSSSVKSSLSSRSVQLIFLKLESRTTSTPNCFYLIVNLFGSNMNWVWSKVVPRVAVYLPVSMSLVDKLLPRWWISKHGGPSFWKRYSTTPSSWEPWMLIFFISYLSVCQSVALDHLPLFHLTAF